MMCMQQVETSPMNHVLHNLHLHPNFLLSGCSPSLNTPIRLAIYMLTPVLEWNFHFLRVYSCSQVSQSHLEIKRVTNLGIFGSHLLQLGIIPLVFVFLVVWVPCSLCRLKPSDGHVVQTTWAVWIFGIGMSVLGSFRSLWKYLGFWLVWTFVVMTPSP